MLVSWKWLSRYIELPMSHEEVADRLSLSGLNHEGTDRVGGDPVIDLEVTSNRGDCLGHLGVAREIAVLYDLPVKHPKPQLPASSESVDSLLAVENRYPEACPRYTARVIRGVEIGPSPEWMAESLRAVGIGVINNVVDATNYVMMEGGQPLHAFDLDKVDGRRIVVRPGESGETIEAIDHRQYELSEEMCVIADASAASAIAGVMGGAASEVDETTRDLVIEAAIFAPLSVRRTARKLKLHSPSSYRFERRVDPAGVDWASRRVCELITETAGGRVAAGVIDTAPEIAPGAPIVLRLSQLERILGITIDPAEVARILTALGCVAEGKTGDPAVPYAPPSWRHDLTREADLIEEVARIHGYDKIPEDAPVPVAPSAKRPFDVAMERIRGVLTAAGMSEAMTPSVVTKKLDEAVSPWTDRPALRTQTPMLEGARRLRRSLIPSLLQGRAANWASASLQADLFEIAHVYLPSGTGETLPQEQYSLGLIAGGDFFALKGVIETLCQRMGIGERLKVESVEHEGFARGGAVRLELGEETLGFLAALDPGLCSAWKLPEPVFAAELSLPVLLDRCHLVPQQQAISPFPSVERDLNFVVAESVRWSELENVVRAAVPTDLADVQYRETYRDPKKDGAERKRILMTIALQSHEETLSGEQADRLVERVVTACREELAAELLAS